MAKDKNIEEITVENPTVEELKELEQPKKKRLPIVVCT